MSERIILLSQYPEIALILWDFNTDEIEESVLFFYIRKRIKYLYQDLLNDEEVGLINELSERYNEGVSLLKQR
ncbi:MULTISPECIES: hypothetical protein [Alteromonas]|uniref:hypothetical protein n=1 Tax=Alteromonas TaxID=226 RepID=UPI0025809D9C|nr:MULTISPECIES: hypothetical protein [Alteromonas]MDW5286940.1 hypothetical protein [Alteromonas macleodii]|tara:strand:+ start:338 stop:556 length:219 start_codon:yes stop_codon:yes gene_type:complete